MDLNIHVVFTTLVALLFMAVGLHNQHQRRGRLQQQHLPRGGGTWTQRVFHFISNIIGYVTTMASLAAFCFTTCWMLSNGRFPSDDDAILDTAMLIVYNMIALYLMPPWCYLMCVVLLLAMAVHHGTHERNREAAAAADADRAANARAVATIALIILLLSAIKWCWGKMQQQWQRRQQQQHQQERMNRQRRPAPPPPPPAVAEVIVLPEAFAEVDDNGDDHDE